METKKVRVTVLSSQVTDGRESEPVALTVFGELTVVEEQVYDLTYTEYATDEGMGRVAVRTTFHITGGSISLNRGVEDLTYQMVFEKGKQHHSIYQTPCGEVDVTVCPLQMWSDLTPQGGMIELYYSLQMEHQLVGYNSLRIEVSPCGARRTAAADGD